MNSLITFSGSPVRYLVELPNEISVGDFVVVESSKGLELGKVVKLNCSAPEEKDYELKFIKVAGKAEINAKKENEKIQQQIKDRTNQLIKELGLEMKISGVELTLDQSKASIYFTAENRVDFRELVKNLAAIFKMRIELRQIGSRDETRIMGGFGLCGKECCCKQFLTDFEHVSVKMAKNQNLSLNPTKISGLCGRLLCCLGYENEHYVETSKIMPKINSIVSTPFGEGKVLYNDLLKQIVQVRIGDENDYEIKNFELNEINPIKGKNEQANPKNWRLANWRS